LWRDAIYDVDRIIEALEVGTKILDEESNDG
jgi:hypothetical protein